MRPESSPSSMTPDSWHTTSEDRVIPAATTWAMSSTRSKSISPEKTKTAPDPRGTPATDAYPPAEYPISMDPSIPDTSAAYLIPLFFRVRASRKALSTSPSASSGPSRFRHSRPNRSAWLSSTSTSVPPSA